MYRLPVTETEVPGQVPPQPSAEYDRFESPATGSGRARSSGRGLAAILIALLASLGCPDAGGQRIALGVPTTVHDSGLLEVIETGFEGARSEYRLTVVAAGSGELLSLAGRGDLDALIAHSPQAELEFMEAGHGVERRRVMHNDFIVVGSATDPAEIRGETDAARALAGIAHAGAAFFSRGDDSGTHRKELELWDAAGHEPDWPAYRVLGQGMGTVLLAASEAGAYTLTDRGTYLSLSETLDLVILVEGDPRLLNVYSVIVVSDARQGAGARDFADWLTSSAGQAAIGEYGQNEFGRSLYIPSAGPE